MADLVISLVAPGVARVRSVDFFDTLEIHRIERSQWKATPKTPGIYLLHGVNAEGKLTVYIGMSTTNMRSRIQSHHVNPDKNWFGVLFAIPVSQPLLCPAIEAELIAELNEAGTVDVIANVTGESPMLGSDDVHVEPAVEKIRDALQLILGADIFAPADVAEPAKLDEPMKQEKLTPLTVAYKGNARDIRPRQQDDPSAATHRFVGLGLHAWGRFEGADPEKDKHFRVLEGSEWRWATPSQGRVRRQQQNLVPQKVLDDDNEPGTFVRDHIFESWSTAASIVAGRGTSGAWRWQRLG